MGAPVSVANTFLWEKIAGKRHGNQSAPVNSGIAQLSPRNSAISALTHWPHWARQPQAA